MGATRAGVVVLAIVCASGTAHADGMLTIGGGGLAGWTSYSGHTPRAIDLGVEATLVALPRLRDPFDALIAPSYGLFLQIANVGVAAGDDPAHLPATWHLRTAAGAQAGLGPLGLEAGLAYEDGDARHAGELSAHVATYFSLATGSVALRLGAPLFDIGDGPDGRYGWELSVTFTLKLVVIARPRPVKIFVPFAGPAR
jgi:hypothetical protein